MVEEWREVGWTVATKVPVVARFRRHHRHYPGGAILVTRRPKTGRTQATRAGAETLETAYERGLPGQNLCIWTVGAG